MLYLGIDSHSLVGADIPCTHRIYDIAFHPDEDRMMVTAGKVVAVSSGQADYVANTG